MQPEVVLSIILVLLIVLGLYLLANAPADVPVAQLGPGGTQWLRPELGPGGTEWPRSHLIGPGGTEWPQSQPQLGPGGTEWPRPPQSHLLGPGGTEQPRLM
jgi:hypothetical protein